jgi:hypothetical protein
VADTNVIERLRSGQSGALAVVVRYYVPDITCDPTTLFAEGGKCAKAVDTMFTAAQAMTFTRRKSSSPPGTRQIVLPVGGRVFTESKSLSYLSHMDAFC